MTLIKLQSVPAWIITDLEDNQAFGPVRLGPGVLQTTAKQYARAETYKLALVAIKASGAAAGIKVDNEDRSDVVAKFVDEITPLVSKHTYHPDAAWGLEESDLSSLRSEDPRNHLAWSTAAEPTLVAAGAIAILSVALSGMIDKKLVLGSLSERHVALAASAISAGAIIVGAEHRAGSHTAPAGMSLDEINKLASGSQTNSDAGAATALECDVFIPAGSFGAITHQNQALIGANSVLGINDLCITPRGLASLTKRGVVVWPEFLATAAFTHAAHGSSTNMEEACLAATSYIAELATKAAEDPEGPFLGACHIAETFLMSWQKTLPFGRPMP